MRPVGKEIKIKGMRGDSEPVFEFSKYEYYRGYYTVYQMSSQTSTAS